MPARVPARLWRRVLAFEIDLLLVTAVFVAIAVCGIVAMLLGLRVAGFDAPSYDLIVALILPFALLSPLTFLCYFVGFASVGGQTPGKKIMRIQIVRIDGSSVGVSNVAIRTLAYALSGLPLGAGFLMACVARRRRALHDFIGGTYVAAV